MEVSKTSNLFHSPCYNVVRQLQGLHHINHLKRRKEGFKRLIVRGYQNWNWNEQMSSPSHVESLGAIGPSGCYNSFLFLQKCPLPFLPPWRTLYHLLSWFEMIHSISHQSRDFKSSQCWDNHYKCMCGKLPMWINAWRKTGFRTCGPELNMNNRTVWPLTINGVITNTWWMFWDS